MQDTEDKQKCRKHITGPACANYGQCRTLKTSKSAGSTSLDQPVLTMAMQTPKTSKSAGSTPLDQPCANYGQCRTLKTSKSAGSTSLDQPVLNYGYADTED